MRYVIALSLSLCGLMASSSKALAGPGPCIVSAKDQYVETIHGCKDGFQATKDTCLNRDPACVDVCRDSREQCVTDSGLPAAIAACNATKTTAIQTCIGLYGPGTHERDQCIDNAQVAGFVCRDGEREAHSAAIDACRAGFKTCAQGCGPGTPPVDALTCKNQARTDFKACKASAREDYQLNKDICRGLGHTCVEACRADRATCVDQTGLDDAIAACNATRATGIATCQQNNPPASAALDACIDQVQVIAFQCRDQAREDAQPGLAACATAFRACIRPACEGASPSGAFLD